MLEALAYLAIGAATGFFAGLLGIGGGTIIVSSLALMFAAQGTIVRVPRGLTCGARLATALSPGSRCSLDEHRSESFLSPHARLLADEVGA